LALPPPVSLDDDDQDDDYMRRQQSEIDRLKNRNRTLEDDIRIRRALSVTTNIEFYKYQVSFKLFKG
jgi:restriction system protein